ncbi:MAG: hypothetical protein CMH57_05330 [Myxococcales bacterium]|nr:hypothetical protein [Myxococcales bacterium]
MLSTENFSTIKVVSPPAGTMTQHPSSGIGSLVSLGVVPPVVPAVSPLVSPVVEVVSPVCEVRVSSESPHPTANANINNISHFQ